MHKYMIQIVSDMARLKNLTKVNERGAYFHTAAGNFLNYPNPHLYIHKIDFLNSKF